MQRVLSGPSHVPVLEYARVRTYRYVRTYCTYGTYTWSRASECSSTSVSVCVCCGVLRCAFGLLVCLFDNEDFSIGAVVFAFSPLALLLLLLLLPRSTALTRFDSRPVERQPAFNLLPRWLMVCEGCKNFTRSTPSCTCWQAMSQRANERTTNTTCMMNES